MSFNCFHSFLCIVFQLTSNNDQSVGSSQLVPRLIQFNVFKLLHGYMINGTVVGYGYSEATRTRDSTGSFKSQVERGKQLFNWMTAIGFFYISASLSQISSCQHV